MAKLQEQDVIKLASSKVDVWIEDARKDTKVLEMHYYGVGKDDFLLKMEKLENGAQLDLRKRLAMTNEFVCDYLIRPIDNIFSAKGTTITHDLAVKETEDAFRAKVKDVKGGLSIKEYLKQVWKDKFITDPNGLVFVEITKEGDKAYLTQKNIAVIKNMKIHGRKPEYICFEPDVEIEDKRTDLEKKQDNTNKAYHLLWVVDDAMMYRVKVWKDSSKQPEILEEESLINPFGVVPAIVNSTIIDTKRRIKISPIHKQIGLLNKYIINGSVREIYYAKHGFPISWAYGNIREKCGSCNDGVVFDEQRNASECTTCGGEGHTYKSDVSDLIVVQPPRDKDAPVVTPNIAGHSQPSIEFIGESRTEQDWTMSLTHYSLWGTTKEKGANETATGRFIDTQPVNNKLNDFADIVQDTHKDILSLLGKFYLPNSYKGSSVNYSRRYLLETPDQIWEKYVKAKEKKLPEATLNQLLINYYESLYQSDDMMKDYYIKLIYVDPLPHYSISELGSLPINQSIKDTKIYFMEWLGTVMIDYVIAKDIKKLRTELDKYVKLKLQEDGRTTTEEQP